MFSKNALVESFIESLDENDDSEVEKWWSEVVKRRIAAVDEILKKVEAVRFGRVEKC